MDMIQGFPADHFFALQYAYKLAQPPEVQKMMLMDGGNQPDGTNPRSIQAAQLAAQGYAIDRELMDWQEAVLPRMYARAGFKECSKADGLTTKDMTGNIDMIVSTLPTDFPPFPIPVPATDKYIDKPYSPGQIYNGAPWFVTGAVTTDALPAGTTRDWQGHSFILKNSPLVWIQTTA